MSLFRCCENSCLNQGHPCLDFFLFLIIFFYHQGIYLQNSNSTFADSARISFYFLSYMFTSSKTNYAYCFVNYTTTGTVRFYLVQTAGLEPISLVL